MALALASNTMDRVPGGSCGIPWTLSVSGLEISGEMVGCRGYRLPHKKAKNSLKTVHRVKS